MKTKLSYTCSVCGQKFTDENECLAHEANHIGLTHHEYKKWAQLNRHAKKASYMANLYNNESMREIEETVIKELIEFENAHFLTKDNPQWQTILELRSELDAI